MVGNAPYCARDYERLDGDLYIAYNDDSGDYTCLQTTDQQKSTGFRVTTFKQDIPGGVGAFPNVFGGFEWGRHQKNSFLPPEESKDGNPLSTVSVKTVPGGFYNAACDIWFNKTDPYDHRDPRQRSCVRGDGLRGLGQQHGCSQAEQADDGQDDHGDPVGPVGVGDAGDQDGARDRGADG